MEKMHKMTKQKNKVIAKSNKVQQKTEKIIRNYSKFNEKVVNVIKKATYLIENSKLDKKSNKDY